MIGSSANESTKQRKIADFRAIKTAPKIIT